MEKSEPLLSLYHFVPGVNRPRFVAGGCKIIKFHFLLHRLRTQFFGLVVLMFVTFLYSKECLHCVNGDWGSN